MITGLLFVGLINESRAEGYWPTGCLNLFLFRLHLPFLSLNKLDP